MCNTLKLLLSSHMSIWILTLLLLVLRIVNSLVSLFPVFTLFHTRAACVALIGIIFPVTATLDAVLIGEFLSQGPDLYIN